MACITQEELMALAKMSQVSLRGSHVGGLQQQVQDILSYVERVKDIKNDIESVQHQAVNIFREDKAISCDSQVLLKQAPVQEEQYFVVPRILDTK
jgi:aspartyl/glutamyl-tRNA(Asn/Gln) amidotransferase C subunit